MKVNKLSLNGYIMEILRVEKLASNLKQLYIPLGSLNVIHGLFVVSYYFFNAFCVL